MISIEKNNINISKLFTWGKKFEISDNNGQRLSDIFIRIVGDEDLNKSRVYALRKSAEIRKKLKEIDSDERLAFIPEKTLEDKELYVENIVLSKMRDLASRATSELQFNIPKEPDSTATLEEQEEYQKLLDEFPQKREDQIRDSIKAELEKEREKISEKSLDDIFSEYERILISQVCETEMISKFRDMCVFFGCYSDRNFKNKFFDSIEEFQNIPTDIKSQLLEFYSELEINSEDLKK
jgi:hypothetical protein